MLRFDRLTYLFFALLVAGLIQVPVTSWAQEEDALKIPQERTGDSQRISQDHKGNSLGRIEPPPKALKERRKHRQDRKQDLRSNRRGHVKDHPKALKERRKHRQDRKQDVRNNQQGGGQRGGDKRGRPRGTR